jgi:hypothetical protein
MNLPSDTEPYRPILSTVLFLLLGLLVIAA